MVLAMFGIAIVLGARWAHQRGALPDNFDATSIGLSGVDLALVIIGALGVLSISSEYATGMIRTSLAAVPQRASLLAAKAVVLAVATLVVSEVLAFGSFLVCRAFLAHVHGGVSLGDPGVLTAVIGSGLFLTAVALLGLGLGAALRHTAGAIAALFTVLFALPAVIDPAADEHAQQHHRLPAVERGEPDPPDDSQAGRAEPVGRVGRFRALRARRARRRLHGHRHSRHLRRPQIRLTSRWTGRTRPCPDRPRRP
jgi:hypothetical protein